ncbi:MULTISPECIES: GNAT family N-acetyltransferase [Gordonibacter]|uniref:GNAT family N-acetyltransferase n=1 Tax=Gordonibacter faecis TaxID=3047475 RepID=A0ABT7DQQ7_9ACTN|nr:MULTISPECIES: GNAT family N-acetyltransferase [unclassified Gordonibacter]MDJ1651557.1 GNAT family N-acetyltransferase [Gordonibacter sp. KGMB12511]
MHFRLTRASDIDRIMDILADGRRALAALGIDQWQGGYPHRDVIEADVARGDSYVVEGEDGRIMATAMVGFAGERDYDLIEGGRWLTDCLSSDPSYGVVHRVAVSSACKGRGAASLLLENAERLVHDRGFASVRIDTHPGNVPMRRLMTKRGYTECGIIYIAHAEEATPDRVAFEKLV